MKKESRKEPKEIKQFSKSSKYVKDIVKQRKNPKN
jgi:hypothetical protein